MLSTDRAEPESPPPRRVWCVWLPRCRLWGLRRAPPCRRGQAPALRQGGRGSRVPDGARLGGARRPASFSGPRVPRAAPARRPRALARTHVSGIPPCAVTGAAAEEERQSTAVPQPADRRPAARPASQGAPGAGASVRRPSSLAPLPARGHQRTPSPQLWGPSEAFIAQCRRLPEPLRRDLGHLPGRTAVRPGILGASSWAAAQGSRPVRERRGPSSLRWRVPGQSSPSCGMGAQLPQVAQRPQETGPRPSGPGASAAGPRVRRRSGAVFLSACCSRLAQRPARRRRRGRDPRSRPREPLPSQQGHRGTNRSCHQQLGSTPEGGGGPPDVTAGRRRPWEPRDSAGRHDRRRRG